MLNKKFTRIAGAFAIACNVNVAAADTPPPSASNCKQQIKGGRATWYGGKDVAIGEKNGKLIFNDNANLEPFNPNDMSAAHRTLPLNSYVRAVTEDGRSLIVQIKDRGPHVKTGNVIDFTVGAAKVLGFINKGVTQVKLYKCEM